MTNVTSVQRHHGTEPTETLVLSAFSTTTSERLYRLRSPEQGYHQLDCHGSAPSRS